MKRLCYLMSIICSLLLLVGCSKGGTTERLPASPVLPSENVYQEILLHFPTEEIPVQQNNIRWIGFMHAEDNSFYIKTVSGDLSMPWIRYLRYDTDGQFLDCVQAPEIHVDKLLYTQSEYIFADGGMLFVYDDILYHTASDGTVLDETELVMESNTYPRIDCHEDTIAVSYGGNVALFAMDLTPLQTWPHSVEIQDLRWGTDGMLYLQTILGQIDRMDPASGVVSTCLPEFSETRQYFGTEHILYFSDSEGIWQICADENGTFSKGSETLLLDWAGSSLVENKTVIHFVLNPETILSFSSNNLDNRQNPVILKPKNKAEVQVGEAETENIREVVIQIWYDADYMTLLESLVADFNKSQDMYSVQLEVLDFLEYRDPVAFQNLLREKGMPDLMIFGETEEALFRNLQEQEYLADLRGFTEPLTGSALAAVAEGEACYRLPLFIRYNTLVTAGKTEKLTVDTLLADCETLEGKEALFSAPAMKSYLMDCIQTAFVDFAAEECHFDTTQFRAYLQLMKGLDQHLNTATGYMIGTGMTHPKMPDRLKSGELRYLVFPVESVDSLGRLKLIFGEEDYTVCGFPDVTVLPEVVLSFSMPVNGRNQDGAAAFLSYILSETVQTSDVITREHFPVTTTGVEYILKNKWFYYNIFGSTNAQGISVQNIYCLERRVEQRPVETDAAGNALVFGTDVKEVAYTDADTALLRELLENQSGGHITDPTLGSIITEEISACLSGDRTIDDTIRVLQSRVGTYLAE